MSCRAIHSALGFIVIPRYELAAAWQGITKPKIEHPADRQVNDAFVETFLGETIELLHGGEADIQLTIRLLLPVWEYLWPGRARGA